MKTTTAGSVTDADLRELARAVEWCVPADLDQARHCLQSLTDALSRHERAAVAAPTSPSDTNETTGRLRCVIARITHDLEGGRVLGVTGLEREVKRYLTRCGPEPHG